MRDQYNWRELFDTRFYKNYKLTIFVQEEEK